MVLLERGSAQSELVWPLLEELTQSAVLLEDSKSADNFHRNSLTKIKDVLERVKNGNETSSTTAPPPPPPPPPPPVDLPGNYDINEMPFLIILGWNWNVV